MWNGKFLIAIFNKIQNTGRRNFYARLKKFGLLHFCVPCVQL